MSVIVVNVQRDSIGFYSNSIPIPSQIECYNSCSLHGRPIRMHPGILRAGVETLRRCRRLCQQNGWEKLWKHVYETNSLNTTAPGRTAWEFQRSMHDPSIFHEFLSRFHHFHSFLFFSFLFLRFKFDARIVRSADHQSWPTFEQCFVFANAGNLKGNYRKIHGHGRYKSVASRFAWAGNDFRPWHVDLELSRVLPCLTLAR